MNDNTVCCQNASVTESEIEPKLNPQIDRRSLQRGARDGVRFCENPTHIFHRRGDLSWLCGRPRAFKERPYKLVVCVHLFVSSSSGAVWTAEDVGPYNYMGGGRYFVR